MCSGPIDPEFVRLLASSDALDEMDAVAVHGFPLDWKHWQIENGRPKRAAKLFHEFTPEIGLCQWFHFEDHRLDDAVRWMKDLGVTYLRTGLSWADYYRPNALAWFDRQMAALDDFAVTVTFCFTPEHKGVWPHYTAPPREPAEFAEFCATMIRRYGAGGVPAPIGSAGSEAADTFEKADVVGND